MKIKLPLTEKFLWDLYKLYNKTENVLELIFPPNSSVKSILNYRFYGYLKDAWDRQHQKEKEKIDFYKLVQKLKENGCLKTLEVKGKKAAMITSKGIEKLFRVELKLTKKKKRKDGRWQMVLFDIPEKRRKHRDYFRTALQYLGYKKLQKSIWVCPYDIEKETKELIERYNLKQFVELLLVEKIGLG
ncbi:MAG: CRISPR-associated endonuclease Cas2 [Nanoarchaeota archaeon]|nr:CRISPR-associated endonuclease Cas2 [Nanoarchaeota archaeon]